MLDAQFCLALTSVDKCSVGKDCWHRTNTSDANTTCRDITKDCTYHPNYYGYGPRWICESDGAMLTRGTVTEVDGQLRCCKPHCNCSIGCEESPGKPFQDAAGNDIRYCSCMHEGDPSCVPRVKRDGSYCATYEEGVCMCSAGTSVCNNASEDTWID